MRHNRWNGFLRVVYFTAILAANGSNVRAQSLQPNIGPIFSLSANGMADAQAYQGWALLLEGELSHPNLYSTSTVATPLLINPQNGSWANTIQLVVTDSTGATQNWPIQLATIPPTSLSLDSINVGRLAWVVSPSATSAIAAGTYRIAGILNTTASAGISGWNGTRNSNPVIIQITAAPASPTALQQEQQAEMLARYDSLLGNTSQAIQDIGALLAQQPSAIAALAMQGDLLAQAGQTANALASYDQAVATFQPSNLGPFPEPPVGLLIPQGLLRSQLLSQSGTRGQPQVAIQISDQGVQSPGVLFLDLQIINVGNDAAQNVQLSRITLQTLGGAGQVIYNNVLSPQLPVFTDFLGVNATTTLRIFIAAQGTVNSFSITENGAAADIFGTPTSFSQTQTVSASFTGTLGALTITANNVTQQYGQPTPPLNSATYAGFLNGDTPASLTGSLSCTTTATQSSPAGTYPITCSGQSSTTYAITYVPGMLTITPAPLTISVNNASRAYGAANPPLNSVTTSGLVNGDTLASLTGTLVCSTSATAASPAGTYSISCSGLTSPNYAITFSPGILTVGTDALIITANNASRQYGAANPALTATFAGFVNGDGVASLGGSLVCTTGATGTSSVSGGPYSINCSGLTSANYAITYVPGALLITPTPLTIVANNAIRPYGANNPALTGSLTGLLNSDPITATFASAAMPTSPVGTYSIAPAALGTASVLSNYNVSSINGTLTITPETTSLNATVSPSSIAVGQSSIVTITLTGPDMVIPIDPSVLGPITVTSPVASDVLSNNGACTPLPSAAPGIANCTVTVTSVEPNGRTLNASFAGSADLAASSGTAELTVTAPLQGQQSCIRSDFRSAAVAGGNYLWFSSIFRVRDVSEQLVHISFFQASAQFQYTDSGGNVVTVNQPLPDAHITIDPSATAASTAFDSVSNLWNTTIPWDIDDNAFLTGVPWLVPAGGIPGDIEPVTVCGTFASDVANVDIGWRWAAAAYSSFSSDDATLGVKPMDTDHDNPGNNHDRAGTPENYKQFVITGARGKGGKNYTGSYSHSAKID